MSPGFAAGESSPDSDGPALRVLYAISESGSASETAVRVAAAIATRFGGELVVGHVATGSDDSDASHREAAQAQLTVNLEDSVAVPVGHRRLDGSSQRDAIGTAVRTAAIDVLVLDDGISERLERQVARDADCDVVTVTGRRDPDAIASLLMPVAGGPHSGSAVDVAGAIAGVTGAWIDLLHVVDPAADEHTAESLLETARDRLRSVEEVDMRVLEAPDVVDTLVEESNYYDVTVIGAPQRGRLRHLLFGSTSSEVRGRAVQPLVVVRRGEESVFGGPLS